MGTIASIGTAIIMLSLGHLRVSTGMLIGQLLLAGFALLLYNYRPEAVYIASLGALTITVGLNRLLFREKRNAMLPVQT